MPGPQQAAQALIWVEWVQFKKAGRWELLVPVRVPEAGSLQGEPWGRMEGVMQGMRKG